MEYLFIFAQFLLVLSVIRDANATVTTGCCATTDTTDKTDPLSTTDLQTTSESPTTTETPTTSDGPTTSAQHTTTTEITTTSQDFPTTDTPSTTDLPTTTELPLTTTTTNELSTTVTEPPSTTDLTTTTGGPTTTSTTITEPPSTTTNGPTTTEFATTSEGITTTEVTTSTTKGISTSSSTEVSSSDKLSTTTIVPDQDDVKNYVIIALSIILGILIITVIIWCVYNRVSRKGQYDVSKKSSDLVSFGTQTEDLSLKGFYGRQLPPIDTNMRLISEKTRTFDFDDQMKSRKIDFGENCFSDKISNSWDLNHLYYPDAPPVVPKHKLLINIEENKYRGQDYVPNDISETQNDITNSFSLLTDHYRNQVSPPYLFKKKHSYLPDVEVPSTSASELSYDIEKKDEHIKESSPKSMFLNRYSPDKTETSSGFSEEQTAPLSTQLIQIGNMSKYTVANDRTDNVAANDLSINSINDFDKTLFDTAVDLHIPIVVDMDSSVPLGTWKEERPKFENIQIENKNPKIKFVAFTNKNHVEETFDTVDSENAPLVQVDKPSRLRHVTFDLEEKQAMPDNFENAEKEITLRGPRYHAHERQKSVHSDETTVSPYPKKKKQRKLLLARKEMGEKILYATYGVKDINRNAKAKLSKGAKKERKKTYIYAYQNTQMDQDKTLNDLG